jgi:hypothetical protein
VSRQPFEPTAEHRNMVRVLRASGVDLETIARALCIDPKTLGKYFKVELTFGHEDIKARMGLALVRVALQGNVNAIKYWLATHGGAEWRVPKDADGATISLASGATIIIKGGLPTVMPEDLASGSGNGADHS